MIQAFSAAIALVLLCGSAAAQTAPAAPSPVAMQTAGGPEGIRSPSILDLGPDASQDPAYASQNNGERARVQPGNNAPMWRQVGSGVAGYSSLPATQAPEAGVLIQPYVQYPGSRLTNAGEAWRQTRNRWIIPYAGAALVILLGALVLFYVGKGKIKLQHPRTGRLVERFTPLERSAHWANALAFCALAISGFVMAFGKFLLLPLIGSTLFGWLSYALKNLHNFAGPLFAVSLAIVFVIFVRDNLPAKGDLNWLLKGGGMLSAEHVKAGRFNAGEKVMFWTGLLGLGLVVVGSGLVLDHLVPGMDYARSTMQIANMVHSIANTLLVLMYIVHIYLGTVGVEGVYEGMKTGYVDETWAREHHELWLDDIQAGRIPAQRSALAKPSDVTNGPVAQV